jgi:hypothetical protein
MTFPAPDALREGTMCIRSLTRAAVPRSTVNATGLLAHRPSTAVSPQDE